MAQSITDIDLETEFGDRFSFWTGASGKRYIHSVYAVDDCPPLPGAIYLEVAISSQGKRIPVRSGRFSPFWDAALLHSSGRSAAVTEIHVHLLSNDESESLAVLADLREGLGLSSPQPAHVARRQLPVAKDRQPQSAPASVMYLPCRCLTG
jgi:hypothetical protein